MIAKQSVYLTGDRSKVVPEGHADAKFLLVREGHEIEEALVEQHGAMDLVNSASKKKAEPAQQIAPPVLKDHSDADTSSTSAPVNGKPAKAPKAKRGPKSKK